MAKQYKVWIQIEEVDEDDDHYENIGEPNELACFDTLDEADAYELTLMRLCASYRELADAKK